MTQNHIAPEEIALRERCLKLAVDASPEDAVRRAGDFLAFIQAAVPAPDTSRQDT